MQVRGKMNYLTGKCGGKRLCCCKCGGNVSSGYSSNLTGARKKTTQGIVQGY
jgi:hypothetical protein